MKRWARARFQPNIAFEAGEAKVTASKAHLQLAREAGREGAVLLKNENQVLPLSGNSRVALFGKGVFDYIKGGGGSGDVTVSHVRNLYDGLTMRENPAQVFEPLCTYYRTDVSRQYAEGAVPGMLLEPEVPMDLLKAAQTFTDTAVIVISRFSGEGWDRKSRAYKDQTPWEARLGEISSKIYENSDFCLTQGEALMVETVSKAFPKVVVVLNIGGMMDTTWFAQNDEIDAVLLAWQGGMEGGMATADLLLGEVSPSGKLPDTFADSLKAYPSTASFLVSPDYVDYEEDIYVGYRYFETIPGAAKRVVYPFGYGLSYTTFSIDTLTAMEKDGQILLVIQVANTGQLPGKEVVQVYYGAPQGQLGKPARELAAFGKTKQLEPGETQILTLHFPVTSMASFDDLGKITKSAYVLEKGQYRFYVGNSVRDAKEIAYIYEVSQDRVTETLEALCTPSQLKRRLRSDGTFEELPLCTPHDFMENGIGWEGFDPGFLTPAVRAMKNQNHIAQRDETKIMLDDVAEGKASLDEFLEQLSIEELAELLGGQPNTGVANTYGYGNLPEYGVPNIMSADGPAGLRIDPDCGIYTTSWPCSTMLASTWNQEIIRKVGAAGGAEVRENNIYVWLTPAVNIHRNPLCGRNFEYYSEDPLLAGELAAAMVEGIQSAGVSAEVKHFACNNKETNRKNSDSRVSERALREIYLKQFEIIVKKAQPMALMTAYNLINSQRCSENKELLTGILRGEWGYQGVVTTDWWTYGEHYKEAKAGNDIKMGTGFPKRVRKAYEAGCITKEEILACAKRVLELILKLD